MNREFYKRVKEELDNNKNIYIATIVKDKKDKHLGKKILKVDNEIIIEEQENIEFYNEIIDKINFNECGKIVKINDDIEINIEHIISKPNLIICGGGHIALSLAGMAKMLDFNITVIDDREEFANKERFPEVDNVICDNFTNALGNIEFNKNSYFVVVTRGHRADQECVEKILRNEFRYLGMIGSKAKVANSIRQLLEKGYNTEDINKVNAPIGINIGAKTPAEIAVSIMAQIIQEKNNENISSIDEEILKEIVCDKYGKVLVSILDKRGSSPRGVDAKMLIKNDRSFIGTIGGGIVENVAYQKAIEVMQEKTSHIETYDLSNTVAAKLGMACGGTIKVLFEYIE
ncbi:XdhC/CoxI family protein [uncultured Clostridium sp.]|uniref:XdhC family protein n=1 Tax=uncultured Clostridium sp. TaxID=59620 RepID=UPI00260107AE|nr:XdhC/CoxI family protein [uncultured Clostridium sp.]